MAKTKYTTRPMNIADFLLVMEANADLFPEWQLLSDSEKTKQALQRMHYGSAEAVFDGDQVVGVQGILQLGIGEAWLIARPDMRDKKFSLMRHSIKAFERLRDVDAYMRVFANTKISETYLKHLGFESDTTTHIWTRKDNHA